MSFSRLKRVLEEKDGSLGTHLRKLEDDCYLAIDKTYRGRRPVTWYQLTATGQTRLQQHKENLMRLLERAREDLDPVRGFRLSPVKRRLNGQHRCRAVAIGRLR